MSITVTAFFLRSRCSCMREQRSEADEKRSQEISIHRHLPNSDKLATLGVEQRALLIFDQTR
jgi:hypothetical protein